MLLLSVCLSQTVVAQTVLCKGALGDPIKKIDFGNGIPEHAGPITESTFNFQANGAPGDGWYTIAKSTNGMLPGRWHQISNHTPNDPDGYMMIINASNEPSVFYESAVRDLCPNTTYQFSAWVINLLTYDGKKPNLTFTIETGQETFTSESGDIDEGSPTDWIPLGLSFKTPADVSNVIIRIRNNGQGGNGNDIAIDDITFSPCGPVIIPAIDGSITTTKSLCIGDTKDFKLSAEPTPGFYVNPQYLWQELDASQVWQDMPAETNLTLNKQFTNAQLGSYKYRLLVAENGNINSVNCRANSPEFELRVVDYPSVPLVISPKTVCVDDPINLTVSAASSYKWTGPNGFTSDKQSPTIDHASADMEGTYHIAIANEGGCESFAEIEVKVVPRPIATIAAVAAICKGDAVQLNASGGTAYEWLPAEGLQDTDKPDPMVNPTKTTTYTVWVSNGYCRTEASITVHVIKDLIANAGPAPKLIKGNSVTLKGQVSGENIDRVFWTPSDYLDDATKLNPVARPPFSMTYTLNVISSTGCTNATDQVFVKVYEKLVVPNAFSPNGDGVNDLWNVVAIDTYVNPMVKVINRYGQLLFEGKGDKTAWDGKYGNEDAPAGIYYYMIYLEPGLKALSGSLTLLR